MPTSLSYGSTVSRPRAQMTGLATTRGGPATGGSYGRSAGQVGGPITTRTPSGGYRALTPGPIGAGNIGGGSGGGSSVGGAPPLGYQFNNNVQANPYLDKAFGYFDELWNKSKALEGETYNKEPALQDYRDTQAGYLKDAQALSGGRGFGPGTGMSMAQMQRYGDTTERGAQELAGNLWNAGLNQRTQLLGQMSQILGGMTGAGSAIAGNQRDIMNAMTDQARVGLDAWYKANMLPIEMEKARSGLVTNQIQALSALSGLL